MAFEIKRNDRRPRYRVALTANSLPVDLTGATAVRFTMVKDSTVKINKQAMTVIDAPAGVVEYAWGATDTDTVGTYQIEIEVDWGSSELQSFPSSGYFTATINPDLA